MRKVFSIVSAMLSCIMIGITLVVGWYQAVQIIDFLPGNYGLENDKWCKFDTSNLCTLYPDRFSMIAMGVIVPIVLGPFLLVFLGNLKPSLSLRKLLLIWSSIMAISIVVYVSGIILYAVL